MARRPNYGFEKRQKELDRQKKKEAKADRKQMKKEERAREEASGGTVVDGEGPDATALDAGEE